MPTGSSAGRAVTGSRRSRALIAYSAVVAMTGSGRAPMATSCGVGGAPTC